MKPFRPGPVPLLLALLLVVFAEGANAGEAKKASYLAKLKEEALEAQAKDSSTRIYRLIISPTWGNLHCLRLQNTAEGGVLIAKRLDGQSGYGDGPLVETKKVVLSPAEFQEFEALMGKSGYEKMGITDPNQGLDGDSWSVEVAKASFHHKASRWCPNAYDPKKRGTEGYVKAFRWAADKAGVTKAVTNKGHSVFDR
jgi:hypothetical protein